MKRSLLALVVTAGVAGCGGDDTSSPSQPAPAPSSGGAAQIVMRNIRFDPASTTVSVGQRVTWTNEDSVDHNVIAQKGADFKSDDFGKGGTYAFTPTKSGTIEYTCTLHPGMDGELTVTD